MGAWLDGFEALQWRRGGFLKSISHARLMEAFMFPAINHRILYHMLEVSKGKPFLSHPACDVFPNAAFCLLT